MSYDWTPERYRRRQPSCWDPPWTRRTTAYQQSSSYELDMYSPSLPRWRSTCWDPPVYRETPRQRPHTDDVDWEVMHHDDSVNTKLNRVIDYFDKFDSWHEEIDRRFENLDPRVMRGSDEFYYDDEIEESEYDDQRRRLTEEKNYWRRNQNFGACGSNPQDKRGRRDGRSRRGSCWDPPGGHQSRHRTGGFDNLQFNHSVSCWEPPPRRASRGYSDYDQPPPTLQLVLDQQPQPSHPCSAAPPPAAAAPPPSLRSDLSLKQPRTTSTIELPPDAVAKPCQPWLPLAVKAPLSASTRQMQADVSSSRKTELETDLHESPERMEEKLIVLNNVLTQKEIEKGNDFTAKREEGVNNIFLETKERDLSMLPEKKSKIEKMEIQSLVDGHTDGFETKKHDNRFGMEGKQRVFVHELNWKTEELGMMKPKLLSLDADARLIPPRNNKPCLIIHGCMAEFFIFALNLDDHISLPSLIFYGGDVGMCSAARCVFDPGGDSSPRLLLSTLVVASCFPP